MGPNFLLAIKCLAMRVSLNNYGDYVKNIDWGQVATVVIAGVVIVLGVLFVLIGLFYAFGAIVSKSEQAAKKRHEKGSEKVEKSETPVVSPAPSNVATAAEPVVEQGISGEVVAAITAAIVQSEEGKPFTIRSIKKKSVSGRNPWANAAVYDNTKPF